MTVELIKAGTEGIQPTLNPGVQPGAKRPLQTLASPVSGPMTNDRQADWFLTIGDNWNSLPEEIKDAMLLLQRAFPASGGGVYFLTPPQALTVVRYCHEKHIAIHADTWWFDPRNYRVGSTVSGLREEARSRGLDLGPPVFKPLTRPWPAGKPHFKGRDQNEADFGYLCTMRVGDKADVASYEAWFSTSAQASKDGVLKAGPWSDNPDHMLQVRAQSHCLKNSLGSGISQMPDDTDDSTPKEAT